MTTRQRLKRRDIKHCLECGKKLSNGFLRNQALGWFREGGHWRMPIYCKDCCHMCTVKGGVYIPCGLVHRRGKRND